MPQQDWRFTTRGLFAAVFWASATCASWTFVVRGGDTSLPMWIRISIRLFMLAGPCIAVGALYGKALLAAGIGTAVMLIAALGVFFLQG